MKKILSLIVALVMLALVGCASVAPSAPQAAAVPADDPLVQAYWACFKISDSTENRGKGTVAFPDAALEPCAKTSKAVQVKYFNDDFGALHTWTTSQRR